MDVRSPDAFVEFAKSNPALAENKISPFCHLNEQELTVVKSLQVL